MPLPFAPGPGDVLFCHYPDEASSPYHPPEMTKTRRVLVLSPRDREHRARTFIVVPLSLTVPLDPKPFHYRLQDLYSFLSRTDPVWVKGDMIGHVSAGRLQAFRERNLAVQRVLTARDLAGAQAAVAAAIGARTRPG